MNQTKRLIHIDIIAGIMILRMIIGHCTYFSQQGIPFFFLLSFYMPWFYYKSGMLFHPNNQADLYKKDIYKFLRYFVVYSFIGWCIWAVCGIVDSSLTIISCMILPMKVFFHSGCISANGALWFLLSLFLVRQIGNFILNKTKLPPPFVSFLCFAIAFLLYVVGWYNYSWWFGNLFSGLCFFLLGYWLKNKEQNRLLFLISTIIYLLVVFAFFADVIDGFPYLYMHANNMYSGSYLLFYPMSLAGIIMTNNLFRVLSKHVRFYILQYIGRNSMNFYVTHWILFVLVTFVSKFIFRVNSSAILFWALLCSSIIFLPLISKSIDSIKIHNKILNNIL